MTAKPAAIEDPRFPFGENWARYLDCIDEGRIEQASAALLDLLGVADLTGKSFLDIGSGSGLSALAARRAGARVVAFDDDPQSVACTAELKCRYFPGDASWSVAKGSALDDAYMRRLGAFDVVYSWGVLHHTGALWRAVENAMIPVAIGGLLVLALYNDQGLISRYWRAVKRLYNRHPAFRVALIALHAPYLIGGRLLFRAIARKGPLPRGMALWTDMCDWLGGWPFETATPDEVAAFCGARGFSLIRANTVGRRHGCNEFVFRRTALGA